MSTKKTNWFVTRKPKGEYVMYDFARSAKQAKDMLRDLEEGSPIAHRSKSEGGLYNIYVKKGSKLWMQKGGEVDSDVVVESVDKIVMHYDGTEFDLDNYPPTTGSEWMPNATELNLDRAKELAMEIDSDLIDYDEVRDAENLQDLQYAIEENSSERTAHDNTYNSSWWGGVVDFFVFHKNGDEYGEALVILRMHRGGDVRGNYSDYEAFRLDSFIEDFPAYFARLTYQINTNKGTITLDTEDMEGYSLLVVEDETDTFDVDDTVTLDDVEEKLDMSGNSIYAKGGEMKDLSGNYYSSTSFVKTNNLMSLAKDVFGKDWESGGDYDFDTEEVKMLIEKLGGEYDVVYVDSEQRENFEEAKSKYLPLIKNKSNDGDIFVIPKSKGSSKMAKGGEIEEYIVIHTSMNPQKFIEKHKLSKYSYEIDESDYGDFTRINFETYPKSQNFLKDKSIKEFYYEPYEEYAKGGEVEEETLVVDVVWKQLDEKGLGKFYLKESDVERLEDNYGSTYYFEIYDDTNESPISYTKMKNILDKSMKDMGLMDSYYAKGGEIYKKGDTVLLQDGTTQKTATVVADGIDSQSRVRVRPQGFPMDMSISTIENDRVYIIKKMAKGGMITNAPEYHEVRDSEYNRLVKSGKIKDTDDNFERFDRSYFDELVETGRIDPDNYFAKGGSLKGHGLAIGDEIVNVYRDDIYVLNRGVVYMVDLSSGKRKITKMSKDDAISTFEKGGKVKSKPCECLTFLSWYK